MNILLTGAGFSHNFGAPLAEGMWAKIYNHPVIKAAPWIRHEFGSGFDYEAVYTKVTRDRSFSDSDRSALTVAISEVFNGIDVTMVAHVGRHADTGVNRRGMDDLIARFVKPDGGLFFTLNHDLYIERIYAKGSNLPVTLPGIENGGQLDESRWGAPLKEQDLGRVPQADSCAAHVECDLASSPLAYIKLHGSHNWIDDSVERRMVIGTSKAEDIDEEPILKAYHCLFETALNAGDARLLVIGYGFRDEHINRVIAEACQDSGLLLHVVSTVKPQWLKKRVRGKMSAIWRGVDGYYQYRLDQLFPKRPGVVEPQDPTPAALELYQGFFGIKAPKC